MVILKITKILLLLLITISFTTSAQNKLILKKGLKRRTVDINDYIGITEKSNYFTLNDWKNACNYHEYEDVWILKKIEDNYIIVESTNLSYNYDTILVSDTIRVNQYYKEWEYVENRIVVGFVPDSNTIVFRKVGNVKSETFLFEDIKSLSFARKSDSRQEGATLGVVLLPPAAIIGSTFLIFSGEPFSIIFGLIGEAWGIRAMIYLYNSMNRNNVKTYNLDEWRIKNN